MDFDSIFEEYYSLFRGQATNIPDSGDREYLLALQFGNNAIRTWDRQDDSEWKELWTTLQEEDPQTYDSSTASYDIDNMRKPPAFVILRNSTNNESRIEVIPANQVAAYGADSAYAYFTGSANTGHTLHFNGNLDSYDGHDIDFTYLKSPQFITTGSDKPDMSDPNYMIQHMLFLRHTNNNNTLGIQLAKEERQTALINMKLMNNTGTDMNSDNQGTSRGWGMPAGGIGDIKL